MDLDWGYEANNGPHTWARKYVSASGLHQSPVNIVRHAVVEDASITRDLLWNTGRAGLCSLTNLGHTFRFEMDSDVVLTGGPLLGEEYVVWQIHCHWGSSDQWGSEHRLDGHAFPAELHIVHYKSEYGSAMEALRHADGFAVVGVWLEVDAHALPSPELETLIRNLPRIKYAGDSVTGLPPIQLDLLLPGSTSSFYTYHGSLTTPPCTECVRWIIMEEPLLITHKEIEAMRLLCASKRGEKEVRIENNFRTINPLGKRMIKKPAENPDDY